MFTVRFHLLEHPEQWWLLFILPSELDVFLCSLLLRLGQTKQLKTISFTPLPQRNKNKPWIYKHGTHGNDWNALSPWLIVFSPAHRAPKELIWGKKKKERLLTLNRLFMFISHLCCDFNQQSPDVATAALFAQEASMCCPESRLSPQFGWFPWEGHCWWVSVVHQLSQM